MWRTWDAATLTTRAFVKSYAHHTNPAVFRKWCPAPPVLYYDSFYTYVVRRLRRTPSQLPDDNRARCKKTNEVGRTIGREGHIHEPVVRGRLAPWPTEVYQQPAPSTKSAPDKRHTLVQKPAVQQSLPAFFLRARSGPARRQNTIFVCYQRNGKERQAQTASLHRIVGGRRKRGCFLEDSFPS